MQICGQREIAKYQENKEKLSKTFFSLFFLRAITLLISGSLFFYFFCIENKYAVYYRILLLEIVSNILDISWFFQGIEDFKKVTIRNFVIKILSVILIFLLIKNENDLVKYIIIYTMSNLLGNGTLWYKISKIIDFSLIKYLEINKYIKPAITMLIPQIATSIYTILDKTMLGSLCNDISEVGYYEQAQKIAKIALTLLTSLNTVLIPKISKSFSNGNRNNVKEYMSKTFNFIWLLSIPLMFGIIAISSKFVPWFFGSDFDKVKILLVETVPIILFIAFSTTLGSQYLMSVGKQNIHTKFVIIGAIANALANFILIPKFKSEGAIIASIISESIIAIGEVTYVLLKKDIELKDIFYGAWKYIISGIVMLIITYYIGFYLNATVITTLIQVCTGVIVYIIMLILLKDKLLNETIIKLKNNIKYKYLKR